MIAYKVMHHECGCIKFINVPDGYSSSSVKTIKPKTRTRGDIRTTRVDLTFREESRTLHPFASTPTWNREREGERGLYCQPRCPRLVTLPLPPPPFTTTALPPQLQLEQITLCAHICKKTKSDIVMVNI